MNFSASFFVRGAELRFQIMMPSIIAQRLSSAAPALGRMKDRRSVTGVG
jgi:hypothetical protein